MIPSQKVQAMVYRAYQNAMELKESALRHKRENATIGGIAETIRKGLRLSLRSLAKDMKISASMLSDLEKGNRIWNGKLVEKWNNALRKYENPPA